MKKSFIVSLVILLLIPSVFADWFHNSEHVTVNMDIFGNVDIVKTSPNGYVDTATVNLTFFPVQTEGQELLAFETSPGAQIQGYTAKFTWKNPQDNADFRVSSTVRTTKYIVPVRQKIDFPILELPGDIKIYTKPSVTIDSDNENIIRTASELVKGEDDLYEAVYKIAEWTKNDVRYNLSTLTADVSQKASWVLENKYGVCDEITSLFIALLRAVGIPARFVSGIAYTNSDLFPEKWGAHGWAEVYFPNYGWVPFDVTYGEFGWIDPTHIKFKDTVDSDESSVYYQWVGRNADLKSSDLELKADLVGYSGNMKGPISIQADVFQEAVGFGSYNLITASIENNADYYYSTELYLSKSREVTVIDSDFKNVLLLPHERKTVYWVVRLDGSLSNRFEYTFPFVVGTLDNITSNTLFHSSYRERVVSENEAIQAAKLLDEEKEKRYSGNVMVNCSISKSEFYQYENAFVECSARNTGNILLDDVNVCFESKCNITSLGISQAKNFVFSVNKASTGLKEVPVTLQNELVSKAAYVNFRINDRPLIEIENLKFPNEAGYDDNFKVEFMLAKKSASNPKNVELIFSQNGIEKKFLIKEMSEDRKYVIDIEAKQMKYGLNKYLIDVNYKDGLGKSYSAKKGFVIELNKATLFQRIILFFNSMGKAMMIGILAGFVIGIGFLMWILGRSKSD